MPIRRLIALSKNPKVGAGARRAAAGAAFVRLFALKRLPEAHVSNYASEKVRSALSSLHL
jgi:hypothetical protein